MKIRVLLLFRPIDISLPYHPTDVLIRIFPEITRLIHFTPLVLKLKIRSKDVIKFALTRKETIILLIKNDSYREKMYKLCETLLTKIRQFNFYRKLTQNTLLTKHTFLCLF